MKCKTLMTKWKHSVQVENKKKNRYPDKLPYDHNRVLLNSLVNGSNSDYINASTVMDHDPRNPAYIITQGTMTHTVADFWQMVWEQGSVVIVMLTKLTENGYQLCHRYWPEEGSEQYHIFEVGLLVMREPPSLCPNSPIYRNLLLTTVEQKHVNNS